MPMNVNRVILVGRLTRDPEMRTTQSGQTVATIGLATSHRWSDKGGQKQEKTEFHSIVIWGRMAEVAAQYFTKGQEAFFEGRLQTRTYTGKDGIERRITEVIAESMEFGSRPTGQGGGYSREGNMSASSQARPAPQSSNATSSPDDDIPTINLDDEKEEIKIEDVPF